MDEKYDAIVLGTGLTECIISGLLSRKGRRVLHIDKNDYYGADCASLSLSQMHDKFAIPKDDIASYGRDRDFSIDLVPKLLMASGPFVRMLVCADVSKYLEFRQIAGSYVLNKGKIYKVPTTEKEAVASSLLGLMDRVRGYSFFKFVAECRADSPATWGGLDLNTATMRAVYAHFKLSASSQEFIGHALALHQNDAYLDAPALQTIERVQLYKESMLRYGLTPYIYPVYGLGELPQAFARCAAVYGGTYMLGTPFSGLLFDEPGADGVARVKGIKSGDSVAYAPLVIGAPEYFSETPRVRKTGKRVVRGIFLLDHALRGAETAHSLQLIMPQSQLGRKNDIYMVILSATHNVCGENYFIAIASTTVETDNPTSELDEALKLLNPVRKSFFSVTELFEPLRPKTEPIPRAESACEEGTQAAGETAAAKERVAKWHDGVIISRSYDATSHFESVGNDVVELFRLATGEELQLTDPLPSPNDQNE